MISMGNVNEFELAVNMFQLFTGYEIIIDEDMKQQGFRVSCYNSPSYQSFTTFIPYQHHLADYCDVIMDKFINRFDQEV